jgi:peroxiredoxin family protein
MDSNRSFMNSTHRLPPLQQLLSSTEPTVTPANPPTPKMQSVAMVIRDDGYDRLLTPLTFAFLQAQQGVQVDILFVLWAVRVLTEKGAGSVRVDGRHAAEEAWLRRRLAQDGDPVDIAEFLQALKRTGSVRFFACRLAAATFGVAEQELMSCAEGIVDSVWFLNEKALRASHCQYF